MNMQNQWLSMFRPVLDYIKSEKTLPWLKTWKFGAVRNFATKREYNGFNKTMLTMLAKDAESDFATMNQIEAHQCSIDTEKYSGYRIGFVQYPDSQLEGDENKEKDPTIQGAIRRSYVVYPIGGVTRISDGSSLGYQAPAPEFAKAQDLIDTLDIKTKIGKPSYNTLTDVVAMPSRGTKAFQDDESYFSVFFHELIHWAGSAKRAGDAEKIKNRNMSELEEYGREELTAELGEYFLRNVTGIDRPVDDANSNAYISHWYNAIKADQELLYWSAGDAQRRVNWILENADLKEKVA
mgnify:CR=1 FL=1